MGNRSEMWENDEEKTTKCGAEVRRWNPKKDKKHLDLICTLGKNKMKYHQKSEVLNLDVLIECRKLSFWGRLHHTCGRHERICVETQINHYPGTLLSAGNESGWARAIVLVCVCVLRERVASRSASPLLFTEGERLWESGNRDLTWITFFGILTSQRKLTRPGVDETGVDSSLRFDAYHRHGFTNSRTVHSNVLMFWLFKRRFVTFVHFFWRPEPHQAYGNNFSSCKLCKWISAPAARFSSPCRAPHMGWVHLCQYLPKRTSQPTLKRVFSFILSRHDGPVKVQMLKTDVWTSHIVRTLTATRLFVNIGTFLSRTVMISDLGYRVLTAISNIVCYLSTHVYSTSNTWNTLFTYGRSTTFLCITYEASKCCLSMDVMCNLRAVKDWPESSRLYFIHVYCSGSFVNRDGFTLSS